MSIYLGHRKTELANTNIPKIDTSKLLKNDGSVSMAANLDLGNYAIDNLKTYPDGNKNAASKKYVDDECSKLLDLDANRQMNGDLDMNDNSIIGIYDISADNSVPSKKFVKNEDAKLNTKITTNKGNITRNKNSLDVLKNKISFSHYSWFHYQNPTKNVYVSPFETPADWISPEFFFSGDYNDKTNLRLLGLSCDSDSTLSTSNLIFSAEAILYKNTGGYTSKVFVSSLNIAPYRISGSNKFFLDLSYTFKDFHSDWGSWRSFQIKVAVPWTGNETTLYFCVDYY